MILCKDHSGFEWIKKYGVTIIYQNSYLSLKPYILTYKLKLKRITISSDLIDFFQKPNQSS